MGVEGEAEVERTSGLLSKQPRDVKMQIASLCSCQHAIKSLGHKSMMLNIARAP